MTINVLFSASRRDWNVYETELLKAFAAQGLSVDLRPTPRSAPRDDTPTHAPREVDYLICTPDGAMADFSPFHRTKAVLSLWAGVENIAPNPTLTQPLVRMVDPSMTEGMVEWVTGHVLRHHLGTDRHVLDQSGAWRPEAPPLARERPVTILGIGALGQACAEALQGLNFPVTGWSRSQKTIPGIDCYDGAQGLSMALQSAEILVLLLPLTSATENIINARRLAEMPKGAVILNPGRGALIDDADLLSALDSGQISHATLDVFRIEPLPSDHRYWSHPQVTVTPHIASETRAPSASRMVAENIRRSENGEPLLNLVNRDAGY
ncbi:MAG: glyoxylate/hydroxypyruvate reductase A [Pseudomonadota bacterium]